MAEAKVPKAKAKSSLLDKPKDVKIPDYKTEQTEYLRALQKKLEDTRDLREQTHEEFDNLGFTQYWWAIERAANTTLEPKKNKGETLFQSGTLRTKMLAFLSAYQGLNLGADIAAFNEYEVIINNLGNAMEDILEKIDELNNDEELKMLRQYEMLKHGYVFVETVWQEKYCEEKTLTSPFTGQVTGFKWQTETKKEFGRPIRTIMPGTSVFLGDLTKYFIEKQPYVFTLEVIDYKEAEALYGGKTDNDDEWEMWKYVTEEKREFSNATSALSENAWRLMGDTKKGQVEVIKYQTKTANEYQILLNGIPMLPIGFPLTEVSPSGEYTLDQQNLESIRHNFAYGKSFIFKNKNIVAVLDMFMKLGVLKTQQSFLPALLNLSGKLIGRDVLMPSTISRGIGKGELVPVLDWQPQGMNMSEFNMIQEVIKFVDRNTASQTFTGAQEQGGGKVTATQIIELQRQARMMMGLMTLAAGLLEKKLTQKSLPLVITKWFEPTDKVLDEVRQMLVNRYRPVSRQKIIEGKGMGLRMVIPTEEIPASEQIKETEERIGKQMGKPIKMILVNPVELKKLKLTWVTTVTPKEKRSSEYSKILFGALVDDAMRLGLPLNPFWTQERFAQVWEEDPGKMFMQGGGIPPLTLQPGQGEGGGSRVAAPQIKMQAPTAEKSAALR